MNAIPRPKSARTGNGASPSSHPATRAAAVLLVVATFLVGWNLGGPLQPAAPAASADPGKTVTRPARPARQSHRPESVRQRMASLRAIASPEERMRATIEMANSLPVSEIAGWMEGRWFNTGGGYDLTLFNKILTARWKAGDPEGFFVWTMENPEYALKRMNSDDFDATTRNNMISHLFTDLGNRADQAESLIALLGSDEEKNKARQLIAIQAETISAQKIEHPADWLERASAIAPDPGNGHQYFTMLRQWEPEKIADLGNQFRSMPDDKKLAVARVIAANTGYAPQLGKELVGDAVRHLVSQPAPAGESGNQAEKNSIIQASRFAVDWSQTDPIAAGTWVQSLPAGDARLWAQKNLAANWAKYDPQEASLWVNTLPAEERAEVRKFLNDDARN